MPVVTNAKCTQVTSTDSTVNVTFNKSLGVFDSSLDLGTITTSDCGNIVDHYRSLEGGEDTGLLSLCMLPGGLLGPQAVPRPPLHSSPAKGLSSAKRY